MRKRVKIKPSEKPQVLAISMTNPFWACPFFCPTEKPHLQTPPRTRTPRLGLGTSDRAAACGGAQGGGAQGWLRRPVLLRLRPNVLQTPGPDMHSSAWNKQSPSDARTVYEGLWTCTCGRRLANLSSDSLNPFPAKSLFPWTASFTHGSAKTQS